MESSIPIVLSDPDDLLPEAYLALDRLNSWVRSKEPLWCSARSKLTPVVYWVKNKAILEASQRWRIGLRRVITYVSCRSCGGSGIYHADYGWDENGEPCRTCGTSGAVALKFIETTIGSIRWHTPISRWLSNSLDVYVPFSADGPYEAITDWAPNTPGRAMNLDDVERDMMSVLEAWRKEVWFIYDFHYRQGPHCCNDKADIPTTEAWLHSVFEEAKVLA